MSSADEYKEQMARIKVVGVGKAGGRMLDCIIASKIEGAEFIALDTKDRAVIEECLKGADMIFITTVMGGATGSDAAPVIAKIAKKLGALTIAVVTKPLINEAKSKGLKAEVVINELEKNVDMLIVLSNDSIAKDVEKELPLIEHFALANNVIKQVIQGIADLIIASGFICNDFSDIKNLVHDSGRAVMGIGAIKGKEKGRAVAAVKRAMTNVLTERSSMEGASGILCSITADNDLSISDVEKAACFIHGLADKNDNIVIGAVINPDMQDEIKVILIATGFDEKGGR